MGLQSGFLITCDRCGHSEFVKEIRDLSEGWDRRSEAKTMCPRCKREYDEIIRRFFDFVRKEAD